MNAVRAVERHHGPVVLTLLGDPSEGTVRCLPAADFRAGPDDVHLGEVCCTPVYADRRALAARRLTVVVIDVDPRADAHDEHFVAVAH
jgi:uncharacterized protein (DUF779 family)